jgi:hypothetical protein
MSITEAGALFLEELRDAHNRHDANDVAQTARIARIEGQWLELQGDVRATLKKLLDGQRKLEELLTTNGTGHGR